MSQTFNLGGLGDNKLTKLIFSNGTANTCSIFLDNDGYLVFEQGANTVTFPLGELPVDKRLAIENGRVVEGRDVVNTGTVVGGDDNQNNLVVDLTEDALTNAVADALGVENLFSAKSEPKPEDGVYPGFTNAMYFNGSDDYLSRTFSSGSTTTWTWSCWIKRSKIDEYFTTIQAGAGNDPNNPISPWFVAGISNANKLEFSATAGSSLSWESSSLYTDTSSWYHLVYVADTTSKTTSMNGSSTDRMRVYANGQQVLMLSGSIPGEGAGIIMNTGVEHTIGGYTLNKANGYMANLQFIDGQALDASAFGQYLQVDGEETNIWIPKPLDPSIDYGANGFYLDFSRNKLDSNGNIDMVHDVAPLTGTHTSANDWTAN